MTIGRTYRPRRPGFSVGFPTGLSDPAGVLCGQEVKDVEDILKQLFYGDYVLLFLPLQPETREFIRPNVKLFFGR